MTATALNEPAELPPLTTDEIAERFRYTRRAVIGWINQGVDTPSGRVRLRAEKIGGEWRVPRSALVAFIRATNPETHAELAAQQARDEAAHQQAKKELDELYNRPRGRKKPR